MILQSSVLGEGPALILIHGLFGMSSNLAMLAKPLSAHFQVISVDLRNHGLSYRAASMDFAEMADDVLRVMDHYQLAHAQVLGHSLGGKVAMQLALNHPERVQKLVVVDIAPAAYAAGNHDDVFAGIQAVDVDNIASRTEAEIALKPFIDNAAVRMFILKNLYRTDQGEFAWRLNVQVLIDCYEQIRAAVQADHAFAGPTLFIKGELSHYVLPEHSKEIERLFSAVSVASIADAGHWLHAEKTQKFLAVVTPFLLA